MLHPGEHESCEGGLDSLRRRNTSLPNPTRELCAGDVLELLVFEIGLCSRESTQTKWAGERMFEAR